MNIKGFEKRINELNAVLLFKNEHIDLYIAGGIAFMIEKLIKRATFDIDVFKSMDPNIEKVIINYDFSTEISNIVKNDSYKEYSKLVADYDYLSNINVYVVSLEYLYILKCHALISTHRLDIEKEKDLSDIKTLKGKLDWEKVDQVLEDIFNKSLKEIEMEYLIKEVYKWKKILL